MVHEDTKQPGLGQGEQDLSNPEALDNSVDSADLDARINDQRHQGSVQDVGVDQLPHLNAVTEPSYKYIEIPIMYSVDVLDTDTNCEFTVHVPSPGFRQIYKKDAVFIEADIESDEPADPYDSQRELHVIMEMRDKDDELVARYIPLSEKTSQLNAPIRYNKTEDGRVKAILMDLFDIDSAATFGTLDELLKKPYLKKKIKDWVRLVKAKDAGQTIEQTTEKIELGQSLHAPVSDKLLVVAYHPTERFMYAEAIDVSGSLSDISDRFKYFFMRLMIILPDQETWKKEIEQNVVRDVKHRFSGIDYFDSAMQDLDYKHSYKLELLKDLMYATSGFLPDAETMNEIPSRLRRNMDVRQRVIDAFYEQAGLVFDELRSEFDIPESRFRYLDAFHLPELREYLGFFVEANPQNGTVAVHTIRDSEHDFYNFCRRVTLAEDNHQRRNGSSEPDEKNDKNNNSNTVLN